MLICVKINFDLMSVAALFFNLIEVFVSYFLKIIIKSL